MNPTRPRKTDTCTVTMCRGCCCGTHRKHPTVDHDAQLRRLRDQIGAAGQVRVSTCLGPCQRSNVAVVTPSPTARRAGARAVWLGWVLDDTTIDAIGAVQHLESGRCVHELVGALRVAQPLVSQHLRILKSAGVVAGERHGREVVYRLVDEHLAHIVTDAVAHAEEGRGHGRAAR